jgi:hypothetical protein
MTTCNLCGEPATGKERGGFMVRTGTTVHTDCVWELVNESKSSNN